MLQKPVSIQLVLRVNKVLLIFIQTVNTFFPALKKSAICRLPIRSCCKSEMKFKDDMFGVFHGLLYNFVDLSLTLM